VRQSPAGENVSNEAEDTLRIRYQATTGGDIPKREEFMCDVTVICEVYRVVRT
jgi:hypothetical protein